MFPIVDVWVKNPQCESVLQTPINVGKFPDSDGGLLDWLTLGIFDSHINNGDHIKKERLLHMTLQPQQNNTINGHDSGI